MTNEFFRQTLAQIKYTSYYIMIIDLSCNFILNQGMPMNMMAQNYPSGPLPPPMPQPSKEEKPPLPDEPPPPLPGEQVRLYFIKYI